MPSPKNRMKSTGDTHLPEVELDLMDERTRGARTGDDEEEEQPSRVFADGYVPPGLSAGSADAAGAAARQEHWQATGRSPWLMAGAVLAAGYVLVKLLRR